MGKTVPAQVYSSWQQTVADQIFDYIVYERNTILFNYHALLLFMISVKEHPLPEIIDFWSDRELRSKIIVRARHLQPEVTVQMASELFMIALQSFIMAGDSMYSQWLSKQDADLFASLTKKQNKIQDDFKIYMKKLSATQKKVTNQIINNFKNGMQKLSDEYKTVNNEQQKEQVYLFKSINLDYPIQHALNLPPTPYDQVFEASRMTTPKSHSMV